MGRAWAILLALAAGLGAGAAIGGRAPFVAEAAGAIGGLWLDGLRMTIVPLVVSLLVSGVAAAGKAAGGALRLFVLLLLTAGVIGAAIALAWLAAWPPTAVAAATGGQMTAAPPPAEWLRGLVPSNIVKAASEGAIVPLVLFALVLGLAAARLEEEARARLTGFFDAVAAAMLIIVGWVLKAAPVGVFAIALSLAARTGLSVAGALASYVLMIIVIALVLTALAYALAWRGAPPGRFARAAAPAQAVAFSTQSSLASLPVMLDAAERMRLPHAVSSVVLPLAVAMFRITAPAGIVAGALTLASIHGVPLTLDRIVAATLVATLCSLIVIGLPGQVSFIAAYSAPAMAAGAPLELLPLLLAVDVLPDMFRTVANVTMDLAVTTLVARGEGEGETSGGAA